MARSYIPKKDRLFVFNRASDCCEYCMLLAAFASCSFCIDHIIAVVLGGTNDLNNLALACMGCNSCKADKIEGIDPKTNQIHALFNPRLDKWTERFEWSDDFLYVIGKTPIGRTTIANLKLNRNSVVNLRTALIAVNVHPPQHSLEF